MPTITLPIHLALLDDHQLFRQGMRYILQSLPFVASVSEAATLEELLVICRQRVPDVLLLDLQMPNIDGQQAAVLLLNEFPDLKIIVLSMFSADKYISQMMQVGVRSYLPKDVDQEELRATLEGVLTTGYHLTPRISRALVRSAQHPVQLTTREREVMLLTCQGRTAAEIATELNISPRTVEGHRQHLLDKTGATNSPGLILYAARHGLFE